MLLGSYEDRVLYTFSSGKFRLVSTKDGILYFEENHGTPESQIWKTRIMPADIANEIMYLLTKSNDHWTLAHDYEEHIEDGKREIYKKIARLEEENGSAQAATAALKAAFNGFIASIVRK